MKSIWDNANIVESYPGVCTPLTFSFARTVYQGVYEQFARYWGIDDTFVRDHRHEFTSMLGYFDGRFYYNLESWCRLISVLPGFGSNPERLQEMMGVAADERLTIEPRPVRAGERLRFGYRLLRGWLGAPGRSDRWVEDFDRRLHQFDEELARTTDLFGAYQLYRDVERTFLADWQTPIVNDFLVMIFTSSLRARYRATRNREIDPAALAGLRQGNVLLVEKLRALAATIATNPQLAEDVGRGQPQAAYELLVGTPATKAQLEELFANFGLRYGNDLKLETPNLKESPQLLIELLRQYLGQGKTDRSQVADDTWQTAIGREPLLIRWLAKESRAALARRELMRVKRSQLFGLVRGIFLVFGEDLARRQLLTTAADIFYLEIDEVLRTATGTSTFHDLGRVATLRRAELAAAAKRTPMAHFSTTQPPQWDPARLASGDTTDHAQASDLIGQPNYPGRVTGEVVVLTAPDYQADVRGKILVCPQTDPAWVPLLGLVRGIVVERGGLLSHAAIVTRELKIPSLLGVAGATGALQSGQQVELDSQAGRIRII